MPPARKGEARGRRGREHAERHEETPEAVRLHHAYLEYRLAGGEAANPKRYAEALEAFRRLPGAIRSAPSATPPAAPAEGSEVRRGAPGGER
jgi:hypothetical protein